MIAKYDGTCVECGEDIFAGETEISMDPDDGAWVHAECVDPRVRARAEREAGAESKR